MSVRLAAVAGLAASLLGATVGVAAPAAAASPDQVALVVQYPDGSSKTACVDYRSGMSGADVLAVMKPNIGQSGPYAGFVLQIGGQGNSSSKPPSDDTYWAYWRSTTGSSSYGYSGAGVTSTRPAAGSVEAWVWYENGPVDFPKRSYTDLCPNGYAADPAPSAAAPAPTAGGAGATGRTGASTGAGTPAAEGSAGSRSTGATGTPGAPTSPATDPSATPTTPASSTGSGAAAGSPGRSTSVAASDVAVTTDTAGGTGRTVGLLVAGLAVLGLGTAAVVVRRRRAQAD